MRAYELRGRTLGELEYAEIRIGMEHGGLDQEVYHRLVPMPDSELAERREFREVSLALDAKYDVELLPPEPGRCEQLEEEIVAIAALANERRLQPSVEFAATTPGQPVDVLIGPVSLGDGGLCYESLADKPVEHLVQVADV